MKKILEYLVAVILTLAILIGVFLFLKAQFIETITGAFDSIRK
jgi:uncharacterized protein YxeA